MKIVSTDLETTGLDEETCQIIEIGAVVEDFQNQIAIGLLPKFHCYVVHDLYQGEPYALAMHKTIFERIAKKEPGYKYLTPPQAAAELNLFLRNQIGTDKYTITGKNFSSFDLPFFKSNPYLKPSTQKFHHRVLDVGSLYFNPDTDSVLPSTDECLARAGLPVSVAHNTIDDAIQIIQLIRKYYEMKKNPFFTVQAPLTTIAGGASGHVFNSHLMTTGFNTIAAPGAAGAAMLDRSWQTGVVAAQPFAITHQFFVPPHHGTCNFQGQYTESHCPVCKHPRDGKLDKQEHDEQGHGPNAYGAGGSLSE